MIVVILGVMEEARKSRHQLQDLMRLKHQMRMRNRRLVVVRDEDHGTTPLRQYLRDRIARLYQTSLESPSLE